MSESDLSGSPRSPCVGEETGAIVEDRSMIPGSSHMLREAVGGPTLAPLPGFASTVHPIERHLSATNLDPGDTVLNQMRENFAATAADVERTERQALSGTMASGDDFMLPKPVPGAEGVPLSQRVAQMVLSTMTREKGFVEETPQTILQGQNYVFNLQETSLGCIAPDNNGRRNVFFLIDHQAFEGVILCLISFNIITMMLDTPGIREQPGVETLVMVLEIIFQTLFTVEMLLKVFALGLIMHEHSYLRSAWNVGDCVIVLFGFVAYALERRFRALRLIRVFRLLRALSKVSSLKAISHALLNSGPRMRDVMALMFFVVVVMAILGLELFVGSFQQRCYFNVNMTDPATNTTAVEKVLDPLDPYICNIETTSGHQCKRGSVCEVNEDVYFERFYNFDNIGNSIFYVLKLVSMDNWPVDNVRMQYSQGTFYFIYSFAVVIFGCFFCLNLVLAILSSEYEAVSNALEEEQKLHAASIVTKNADADDEEDMQFDTQEDNDDDVDIDLGIEPEDGTMGNDVNSEAAVVSEDKSVVSSNGKKEKSCLRLCREAMLFFVTHRYFARFILLVTCINVLCLGLFHHNINPTFLQVLDTINLVCSFIFIAEMLMKWFAMGLRYFKDGYNTFDCALVIISIPELVIGFVQGDSGGSAFSALRAFRLARVLRVLNSSLTMRQLLMTVADSAKSSAFLFLFLFLFILTMALFAVNFLTDSIVAEARPNFTTLGNSVLALFVVLTGEDWVEIGTEAMAGSHWATVFFFYVFYGIGNYVLLNFVIVILITSFNKAADRLRDQAAEEAADRVDALRDEVEAGDFETTAGDAAPAYVPAGDADGGDTLPKAGSGRSTPDKEKPDEKKANEERRASLPLAEEHKPLPKKKRPGAVETVVDPKTLQINILGAAAAHQASGDFTSAKSEHSSHHPPDSARSQLSQLSVTDPSKRSTHKSLRPVKPEAEITQLKHYAFEPESAFKSIIKLFQATVETDEELQARIKGKAFFVFAPDNPFRWFCARLVSHPWFEAFVFVVILWSCIALGFDNPSSRQNASLSRVLDINGYVLVGFFIVEAFLRSVAWGMWYSPNDEETYLSDKWNRVDFFVLIMTIISIPITQVAALRSLRIFRLAAKVAALRVVISATLSAMPAIGNVALLLIFNFIVFGILGVQIFAGTFVKCNDETIDYINNCTGTFNVTDEWIEVVNGSIVAMSETRELPRLWRHSFFNFNHVGIGVLTLLQQMFGDGWSAVMYDGMDSRSTTEAMAHNARWYYAIFFIIFMIIGNFFLINLFVGSLIDSFSHERQKSTGRIDTSGNPLLTEEQDHWIRTFTVLSATKLLPFIPKPGNPFRALCCRLYFKDDDRVEARQSFELLITGAIILNAVLMMTRHFNEPKTLTDFIWGANLFFACLYTVEAVIKLTALLPNAYFADSWNRFDFVLVPTAFFSLFVGGPGTNAIRVLRVARVLRLVKRAKGLKRLFDSLLVALPQLMNITLLLLLVLFVFGVVAVALFSNLLLDPLSDFPLNEFFNFKNAGQAMILLFQISTTESWSDVMKACWMTPENSRCTYEAENCGNWGSIPFFVLFMFFSNSIALNLFIFVIVENYMEVNQLNSPRTQQLFHRLSLFRTQWSLKDREGTQLMHWEALVMILRRTLRESARELHEDDDVDDDVERLRDAMAEDAERGERTAVEAKAEAEDNRFLGAVRDESEAVFLRHLRIMDIPVSRDGLARYADCVYGITKEFYGLDDVAAKQATQFLALNEEEDPTRMSDCFKVHHALAVRKLARRFRQMQKEKAQAQRVRTSLALNAIRRKSLRGELSAEDSAALLAHPSLLGSMLSPKPPRRGGSFEAATESGDDPDGKREPRLSPRLALSESRAKPASAPETPDEEKPHLPGTASP